MVKFLQLKLCKSKNGIPPEIMDDIFHFIEKPYNFRNPSILQGKRDKKVCYGVSSLASKVWKFIPNSIKNTKSLPEFKSQIKA